MKYPLLILVLALFVGCSGSAPSLPEDAGDPEGPSISAPPGVDASPIASIPVAELGCPNEAALRRDLAGQTGTTFDLDADGSDETVSVARDPDGPNGCQALVAISGDGFGSVLAPIEGEPSFDLGLPAVLGAAEIDGAPPQEVIVNVASGASTAFAAVFSVLDGELIRRFAEGDSPYTNLFPYGGSVGHIEGTDCAGEGRIVIASALPSGDGYVVERRFFVSEEAAFVLDENATETSQLATDDLARIAEFGGTPFASCPQ